MLGAHFFTTTAEPPLPLPPVSSPSPFFLDLVDSLRCTPGLPPLQELCSISELLITCTLLLTNVVSPLAPPCASCVPGVISCILWPYGLHPYHLVAHSSMQGTLILISLSFRYAITKAFVVAFVMTFFSVFDVPVFWPILCYWIVLFVLTMKRQIVHMIKYKYVPFNIGKQKYGGKKSGASSSSSKD
ncbi:hypothetical protein EJB05_31996, partial [Eragrostis curvula]